MKETAIKIGGKSYLLTALDAQAMKDLHEEFQRVAPCPLKEVVSYGNELPEHLRDKYIMDNWNAAVNRKRARNNLDSVEFKQWLKEGDTLASAARIYHLMFRKHHPELTPDECFALAVQAIEEGGDKVFAECFQSKLEGAKVRKGRGASVPAK